MYYSGGTGWGKERRRRVGAAYADNALCLRKKLDFIVGFIHHQYMTPSNLHTVIVEQLCAWSSLWDQCNCNNNVKVISDRTKRK